MALKSYRLFKKGKKMKMKKIKGKVKPLGNLVVGGITALVGVALLDQTAQAVARV